MPPLLLVRRNSQAPLPIFPASESPPVTPETVTGSSLEIWPKEVLALTL